MSEIKYVTPEQLESFCSQNGYIIKTASFHKRTLPENRLYDFSPDAVKGVAQLMRDFITAAQEMYGVEWDSEWEDIYLINPEEELLLHCYFVNTRLHYYLVDKSYQFNLDNDSLQLTKQGAGYVCTDAVV